MTFSVKYGTRTIEFTVIYRKRKTLEIRVEAPGIVSVIAPVGTNEKMIKQVVKKKGKWIVQKLFLMQNVEHQKIKREFVSGEAFLYLGRNYTLQLFYDEQLKTPQVKLFRGKFYVTAPTKEEAVIKQAMEQWYRQKTYEKVKERITYYQHHFTAKPTGIKVKEQKRRWASCTANRELLFNWRCVMAPSPVLDYIVVHEMCHMVHMNHSKAFWDLVASIMPDYQERKEWLKKHGVRMDL